MKASICKQLVTDLTTCGSIPSIVSRKMLRTILSLLSWTHIWLSFREKYTIRGKRRRRGRVREREIVLQLCRLKLIERNKEKNGWWVRGRETETERENDTCGNWSDCRLSTQTGCGHRRHRRERSGWNEVVAFAGEGAVFFLFFVAGRQNHSIQCSGGPAPHFGRLFIKSQCVFFLHLGVCACVWS